jgi:hypothetical protein
MKIAADLLIGDHNILRLEVLEKTDAYLKTIDSPANKPIHRRRLVLSLGS